MPPINLSLDPFTGTFGAKEASHLVRRTTFVHNESTRNEALGLGRQGAVSKLLEVQSIPSPPLNYGVFDLFVPIGQTWINSIYVDGTQQYRRRSLQAWTIEQMAKEELNIREKMVLFWHNHFAISDINDPHFLYKYSSTLREHALGNFRALVKAITIDPAMLRFLNGNSNTNQRPNENYARELLELFTIGKGPIAGPGDYTNYTEEDIGEIARILTGWTDIGYRGQALQQPGSTFINFRHDQGTKQLSHRFNNVVINNANQFEYSNLIDIIFEQDEVARYISRKLYRYFIYYDITPEIEATIIEGLAQTMIANDYEVLPVLSQLFNSQHFFESELMGCQIKNPMEFLLPLISNMKLIPPDTLGDKYGFNASIFVGAGLLDMIYFQIPQVAGWKAYYQEPVYYRYWINNVTLGLRSTIVDLVVITGFRAGSERVIADLIGFIENLPNPSDPNDLIIDSGRILFTHDISASQVEEYKEALIPGLPDFEWTVEYNNYLANPDDEVLRLAIHARLATMYRRMLNAPDYHLQ